MTHFSGGVEAAIGGAIAALNDDDIVTSNLRGHAQVIAKGIDLNAMIAESLGKYSGICKGIGGSIHIADVVSGNLGPIG
ncbi:thiamine pyrophosphate-dependent enzyme, partial [Streptobacillus moniliformis]|uniref:thiamine pyrophosphate-dependent enzyme n=1 Tax=Streptobacillus moniliformis TaxID=34105 RepID=UPI002F2624AF